MIGGNRAIMVNADGSDRYMAGSTAALFPTDAGIDYALDKGMTAFRLPFAPENIQPTSGAALSAPVMARMKALVARILARSGRMVVLDLFHGTSFAFRGTGSGPVVVGDDSTSAQQIGSSGYTPAMAADFWGRVAAWVVANFGTSPPIKLELFNEPPDLDAAVYRNTVNGCFAAIRAAGFAGEILVGAMYFNTALYVGEAGRSSIFDGVVDPLNKWVANFHYYPDPFSAGDEVNAYSKPVSDLSQTMTALNNANDLCVARGRRFMLTEFGIPNTAPYLARLRVILEFLKSKSVDSGGWCQGWTYWAFMGGREAQMNASQSHFAFDPNKANTNPTFASIAYGDMTSGPEDPRLALMREYL